MPTTSPLSEQNHQLVQEVKRRTNQMAAINAIANLVGQSLDLEKTLTTALDVTQELVKADASGISLIDEAAGQLVLRAQRGWMHDFVVTNPMRIPLNKGMSGEVLGHDDVVIHNNLTGDEDYAVPSFRAEHFRSIVMAPMHARGRIVGILSIMSHEPHCFDDDMADVLRVVADTIGLALDNARLYSDSIAEHQRMQAILHATADGILATDALSRVILVNNAAERLLDTTQEALMGVTLQDAPINDHIRNQLLLALVSREQGEGKTFQATLGDSRVIAVVVNPVLSQSSTMPDGWVIVLQDVTHQRQAQLARAKFLQAAGHDMRNPLSISLSSLITLDKLLKDRDPAVDEVIHLALGGLERLQTIIDDLLQLEHIESGYNFRIREFNLLDVLHEIQKESANQLLQRGVTLTLDTAPDIPTLHADVRWFKRAIHNYLNNATKYTPTGGGVTLRIHTDGDTLIVEVEDNGVGIPVHAQARIFDRFYRVDGDKSVGSGLGLAIVKSVAQAHGGQVYLRSQVGEGSVFGFRIPVNPPEELKRDIRLPESDDDARPAPKLF